MSDTLYEAFNQWSKRPADQRFSSLSALKESVKHWRDVAVEIVRPLKGVAVVAGPQNQPQLMNEVGQRVDFTHHSFGQFARKMGAPAEYLRGLPVDLVVSNLQHGLATAEDLNEPSNLLMARGDTTTLRSVTTDSYRRIYNMDVVSKLEQLTLEQPEWQPAPAAFDGSRGLYASDHDMFCFMVDNERRIFEQDKNGGLGRGFFVWNSEVGAASFGIKTFYYEYVCGNHRVWGASGVQEIRIKHVGNADARAFAQLAVELRKYADANASGDEAKITVARSTLLGVTKDEVLDAVFNLKTVRGEVSKKTALAAYARAEEHSDWYGDPRSVWGFTGGLTEYARDMANTDERVKLDSAAGKILATVF